ncbi:MAG: NERD domain-containing protein, partial [Gemmatimonadetes bacterium]|nr:NERD domain-containing protein [Gemmatimonadota bacterium]
LGRIFSASMLSMAVTGCVLGLLVRGLPWFDRLPAGLVVLATLGVLVATLGTLLAYVRRVDATWGRGMEAERRVGDLIEHAVAQPGCAFAHDVKEALGGRGNVDHVVMTPAGLWVVETKAAWLSGRRFPGALRQTAENTDRVRRHLQTSLPVRGALVIADPEKDSHNADHDWNEEPVKVFGAKTFWTVLRTEVGQTPGSKISPGSERVARRVWGLGSMRYLDP